MHATTTPPADERTRSYVADTLDAAADYIAEHGWCRDALYGTLTHPTPPACALGAVRIVTYGHLWVEEDIPGDFTGLDYTHVRHVRQALAYLADHLNADLDWRCDLPATEIVGDWNDSIFRTAPEVIDRLHQAAIAYRAERAS